MNDAQIKALREMGSSDWTDANPNRLTISKTEAGWEARKGGKLVGVCQTREGAKELLGAF